jgi:hypothetical protein
VSIRAIEDGVHDLSLSQAEPRQQMFNRLHQWLASLDAIQLDQTQTTVYPVAS